MQYAINYNRKFPYLDKVDEVILNHYSGSEDLVRFVTENFNNPSQRIVVNLLEIEENEIKKVIDYINMLRNNHYNIAVIITRTDFNIKTFKEAGIPFFFNEHAYNLETAYTFAEIGVSDIYVVEELGFRMKDLQYLRTNYRIKIRVFPNIAQSANNHYVNGMQRFWIRPEDVEIYEPYIDIFELVGKPEYLPTVYEIYSERQWLGNLNDIILDFKEPLVNNRGMNPHFAEMRLNCGKKCLLNQCNICSQSASLADAFVAAGVEVIKPRFKQVTPEEKKEILEKVKGLFDES